MNNNIHEFDKKINRAEREELLKQHGKVILFTGLSGAGKSTLANQVCIALHKQGILTYLLDGDTLRKGICADLGFSDRDREENMRRVGEVCKLFYDTGVVVLSAFISPFRKDRDAIRESLPEGDFIEVFVDCPLTVCEERDPKGLYKKARNGEINDFTGISSPYEVPSDPEIHILSNEYTTTESVSVILGKLSLS